MKKLSPSPLRLTGVALALAALCGSASAQSDKELAQQLQQLRDELRQCRGGFDGFKRQPQAPARTPSPAGTGVSPPWWARETGMRGNNAVTPAPGAPATGSASGTGLR